MTRRQVALDLETTGLEVADGDRIIEIGCVEINDREIGSQFHRLVNPQRASSKKALEVHGITDESLRDEPLFNQVWPDLYNFIKGSELIIHNADFDVSFLDAELVRMQKGTLLEETGCEVCDTLALAKHMHPALRNNLDALSDRYSIDRSQREEYHNALADAELLARVYLAMTGGQVSMAFAGESRDGLPGAVEAWTEKADFKVIKAQESELREHDKIMRSLESNSAD